MLAIFAVVASMAIVANMASVTNMTSMTSMAILVSMAIVAIVASMAPLIVYEGLCPNSLLVNFLKGQIPVPESRTRDELNSLKCQQSWSVETNSNTSS